MINGLTNTSLGKLETELEIYSLISDYGHWTIFKQK